MINRIKQYYIFKEFPKNKDAFVTTLYTSILSGEWSDDNVKGLKEPLFSIGTVTYSQEDFARYINNHQSKKQNTIGLPFLSILRVLAAISAFAQV